MAVGCPLQARSARALSKCALVGLPIDGSGGVVVCGGWWLAVWQMKSASRPPSEPGSVPRAGRESGELVGRLSLVSRPFPRPRRCWAFHVKIAENGAEDVLLAVLRLREQGNACYSWAVIPLCVWYCWTWEAGEPGGWYRVSYCPTWCNYAFDGHATHRQLSVSPKPPLAGA